MIARRCPLPSLLWFAKLLPIDQTTGRRSRPQLNLSLHSSTPSFADRWQPHLPTIPADFRMRKASSLVFRPVTQPSVFPSSILCIFIRFPQQPNRSKPLKEPWNLSGTRDHGYHSVAGSIPTIAIHPSLDNSVSSPSP